MARAIPTGSKVLLRAFAAIGGAAAILGAVATVLALPAQAAGRTTSFNWAFVGTGAGTFASNPSCATYANSTYSSALCAAIAPSGIVWFNFYNGFSQKFQGWVKTTGETAAVSDPSCTPSNDASFETLCAARGATGTLLLYQYLNGALGAQLALSSPTPLASAPSCTSRGQVFVCVARSASSQLIQAEYADGSPWNASSWSVNVIAASLPVLSSLSCTSDGTEAPFILCGAITTDSNGLAVAIPQSGADTFGNIGGTLTNPPVCMTFAVLTALECYVTGENSDLNVGNAAPPDFYWSGWSSLGGLVHGTACQEWQAASGPEFDGVVCGVTGLIDSGFWVDVWTDGGEWSGWSEPGTGTYTGTPSCPVNLSGGIMCMIRRTDGGMEAAITTVPVQ